LLQDRIDARDFDWEDDGIISPSSQSPPQPHSPVVAVTNIFELGLSLNDQQGKSESQVPLVLDSQPTESTSAIVPADSILASSNEVTSFSQPAPVCSSAIVAAVTELTSSNEVTSSADFITPWGREVTDDVDLLTEYATLYPLENNEWHFLRSRFDARVQPSIKQRETDIEYMAVIHDHMMNELDNNLFEYSLMKYKRYIQEYYRSELKSVVVLCPYGIAINQEHIDQILTPNLSLSYEVMGFYCKFLNRRARVSNNPNPEIVIASHEFYTRIREKGNDFFETGKLWLGQSASVLFRVPKVVFICRTLHGAIDHFVTLLVNFDEQKFYFYDSAANRRAIDVIRYFKNFLKDFAREKGFEWDDKKWKQESVKVAQQGDGVSCGVFAVMFMELMMRGRQNEIPNVTLTPTDVIEWRKKIFITLVNNHMYEGE
jgi:hypothetical protein